MRVRSRIALVIAVLVLLTGGVELSFRQYMSTRADAAGIVMDALRRDRDVSYTADVVTSAAYGGKVIDTRAVLHHSKGHERIDYANMHGAYMIDAGGVSYSCVPAAGKLVVSRSSGLLSERDRVRLLKRNYTMTLVGTRSVAGRQALQIAVIPRSGDRGRKILWIDRDKHVVLKSEDITVDGRLRSKMEFTRVNYTRTVRDSLFAMPSDPSLKQVEAEQHVSREEASRKLGFNVVRPKYIPDGFKFDGYSVYNCPCGCGHLSAQLAYTDGLSALSVFLVPAKVSCGMGGKCDVGGSASRCEMQDGKMAKLCKLRTNDKTVVVVGDISPDEIRTITQSVR